MSDDLEEIIYMMAVEKTVNLIFNLEMTLDFYKENNIKPDDSVIKVLGPLLGELDKWVKQSSH